MPGLPRQRLRLGLDFDRDGRWTLGAALVAAGASYYRGDEPNQASPLPGYAVLSLRGSWRLSDAITIQASAQNLLGAHYSTFGLYGDPFGLGVPGVPSDPSGVDPRFQSPAALRAAFVGIRVRL